MRATAFALISGMSVIVAVVRLLDAQAPAQKPVFEVASIKRNNSGSRAINFAPSPGRFVAQNVTLRMLIHYTYDLYEYQVLGAPDWINSDRYDIEANVDGRASRRQIEGPMLQTLLEEKFKLVSHRETRELPIYMLTVAKGGAKLKKGNCLTRDGTVTLTAGQDPASFCGFLSMNNNVLRATQIDMAHFAPELSIWLKRSVVDKTGIRGTFDVELKWNLNETAANVSADASPSIFTAIQEQLGLKLESGKGPVEVLVIDSVSKPSEN